MGDYVAKFLDKKWGISKLRPETHIPEVDFTFAITGTDQYFYAYWIMIEEVVYPRVTDPIVIKGITDHIPAKLYIAIPEGLKYSQYKEDLRAAKERGVGILEVSERGKVFVSQLALPLSLLALRTPEFDKFPKRYRTELSEAVSTFQNGDPSKGCSKVYDLIEDLCRRIYTKCDKLGFLNAGKTSLNIHKASWDSVVDFLRSHMDTTKSKCPLMTKQLLNRISGLTPHRNDSGHKIDSRSHLVAREKQLRTRFEAACDTLYDLVAASRPLKGIHK